MSKDKKITMKQEIFCQEWVDSLGDGTQASLKAFDIEGKEILLKEKPDKEGLKEWVKERERVESVASSMGTEYLRKPDIIKRIDEILEERGFNDDAVKREHFKLIRASKDEVKMRAIDSYYKLKGKFIDKVDITTKGEKINTTLEDKLSKKIIDDYENKYKTELMQKVSDEEDKE